MSQPSGNEENCGNLDSCNAAEWLESLQQLTGKLKAFERQMLDDVEKVAI